MNKLLAKVGFICVVVLLAGCTKTASEHTSSYMLPSGLEDCKIFSLRSDTGTNLTVVRCPLSSTTTTYNTGKTTNSVSVVEGGIEMNGKMHKEAAVEINGEMYKRIPK